MPICLPCLALAGASSTPAAIPVAGAIAVVAPMVDRKRHHEGVAILAGLSELRMSRRPASAPKMKKTEEVGSMSAPARVGVVTSQADVITNVKAYIVENSTGKDLSTASWRQVWEARFGKNATDQAGITAFFKDAGACVTIPFMDGCAATGAQFMVAFNAKLGKPADNSSITFADLAAFLDLPAETPGDAVSILAKLPASASHAPVEVAWNRRLPPAWISDRVEPWADRVGSSSGVARVGAAPAAHAKRYVDVRGAPWEITVGGDNGDQFIAESAGYRASKRTGAAGGNLGTMLETIDAYVADAINHKRVSHASTDEGASAEGVVTDADKSEWTAFYFKQQTDAEPDGQTGYYAERYGALVGPSYVGTSDLKTIVDRYLDRLAESKGTSTFTKGDAESRVDDAPAKSALLGTGLGSSMDTSTLARWVLLPAVIGGVVGGALAGLPGLVIGGVAAGIGGAVVRRAGVPVASSHGQWIDETQYQDVAGKIWKISMVGGAWSATSPAYSTSIGAAVSEGGRESLPGRIDTYVANLSPQVAGAAGDMVSGCGCAIPQAKTERTGDVAAPPAAPPPVASTMGRPTGAAHGGSSPYDLHHANASRHKAWGELLLLADHISNDPCSDCMNKHLGQAIFLLKEARTLKDGDLEDTTMAGTLQEMQPALGTHGEKLEEVVAIRRRIGERLGIGHAQSPDHVHGHVHGHGGHDHYHHDHAAGGGDRTNVRSIDGTGSGAADSGGN